MIEDHGGGENQDQPFRSQAEQASMFQIHVDAVDEHTARKEAGDDDADNQQHYCGNNLGDIGNDVGGQAGRQGGVKGGDTDKQPGNNGQPENDARGQEGGRFSGRPVGNIGETRLLYTGVKVEREQDTAQDGSEKPSG